MSLTFCYPNFSAENSKQYPFGLQKDDKFSFGQFFVIFPTQADPTHKNLATVDLKLNNVLLSLLVGSLNLMQITASHSDNGFNVALIRIIRHLLIYQLRPNQIPIDFPIMDNIMNSGWKLFTPHLAILSNGGTVQGMTEFDSVYKGLIASNTQLSELLQNSTAQTDISTSQHSKGNANLFFQNRLAKSFRVQHVSLATEKVPTEEPLTVKVDRLIQKIKEMQNAYENELPAKMEMKIELHKKIDDVSQLKGMNKALEKMVTDLEEVTNTLRPNINHLNEFQKQFQDVFFDLAKRTKTVELARGVDSPLDSDAARNQLSVCVQTVPSPIPHSKFDHSDSNSRTSIVHLAQLFDKRKLAVHNWK
jgi:hypothetical protein